MITLLGSLQSVGWQLRRGLRAASLRLACLVTVCVTLAGTGCKDERFPLEAAGGGSVPPSQSACRTPSEGCACPDAERQVECGIVKRRAENAVSCTVGTRTCQKDGTWGACVPDDGGNRLQAVGWLRPLDQDVRAECANECDPFCRSITDDPDGLDLGADDGLTVDGGVTLVRTEPGTPQDIACDDLLVSPATATLTVTQFSPVTPDGQQFTASLDPPDCFSGEVPVLWTIDPDSRDVATIDASGRLTVVRPVAKPITITAFAGMLSATATLDVRVQVTDTSNAPAGVTGPSFSGAGTDDTLRILYPYAGTVFPLGLLPPLIQWDTGDSGAASAVKVSLRFPDTGTTFDWSKIVPEDESVVLDPPTDSVMLPEGPRASIPPNVWQAFEQTAVGRPALLVVQRRTGTTLRGEYTTRIRFATDQLRGTVYYESYGTRLVRNFESTYEGDVFGAATLAARPGATFPTVVAGYEPSSLPFTGTGCRACHAASADGSVLVANFHKNETIGESLTGASTVFRLGTDPPDGGSPFVNLPGDDTIKPNGGRYSWPAIYPDGSLLFSHSGPAADFRNTAPPGGLLGTCSECSNALYSLAPTSQGSVIPSTGIPSSLRAAVPAFSPDGSRIAFNHYAGTLTGPEGDVVGDKRSLTMMDFNRDTMTFSGARSLTTHDPDEECSVNPDDPSLITLFMGIANDEPCTDVWPSFLPEDAGVVYEREVFPNGLVPLSTTSPPSIRNSDFGGTRAGCDYYGVSTDLLHCSNNGTRANLWWVSYDGITAPLRAANGFVADGQLPVGDNNHDEENEPYLNYGPSVNPRRVGGYYWMAFTSRRLYGNVATMNPWWSDPRYKPLDGSLGPTTKKIWVSAIDPGNLTPGSDPSFPAFYLPGQEYLAGNSRAFWVLDPCKPASTTRSAENECTSDLDCCGSGDGVAVCSLQTPLADPPRRHCIPVDPGTCIEDDTPEVPCTAHTDCCGFSSGSRCDVNGVCQEPPGPLLYSKATYVRDFAAECPGGTEPEWLSFEWQARLPPGTSIDFEATTAQRVEDLDDAETVDVGRAEPPDTTGWTGNEDIVIDEALHDLDLRSQEFLRVAMTLNPDETGSAAPVLTNWRVTYDCVSAE